MSDSEIDVEAIRQRLEAKTTVPDYHAVAAICRAVILERDEDTEAVVLNVDIASDVLHMFEDARALLALLAEKDRQIERLIKSRAWFEDRAARLRQQVEEAAELLSLAASDPWAFYRRRDDMRAWLAQREDHDKSP